MNAWRAGALALTIAAAGAVGPAAGKVGVTNVVATPRWPWDGKVDITYEVLADAGETNLYVTFAGRDLDRDLAIPVSTLTGDGAQGRVLPGPGHAVWDAAADAPQANAATFAVTVSVTTNALYMVIDLSGGPSVTSYPVSYLGDVPAGGWTEEYKTTKLVMRRIPAGTFTMGSPPGELGRDSDETQHQVTLTKGFYLGVFEVTQKQWERVMGTWPSYFNNATYRDSRPVEDVSYYQIRENPVNNAISPNWPQSSQVHADSFMGKLRAKTGLTTLDLPTESQWEYACRAGTTTALNSGRNLTGIGWCPNMSEVGRYWYNGGSGYSPGCDPSAGTATVGSYLANAWGLYDMHGDVYELCLDWYGTSFGTVTDPVGAAAGSFRVIRGGYWDFVQYGAGGCRSANRSFYNPSNRSSGLVGFRAARTLP